MILIETQYETHNGELLAIVKVFKTWKYYLKSCKYKVLVLTNHNNLQRFIDIKSLSSRQGQLTQKLSWYYFRIDYLEDKANEAADTLSQYPWQSAEKKKTLWAKNTKI